LDIPGQNAGLLPQVWGEGAIFAFSGVDGQTCTTTGFTATFDRQPYNFLVHTPFRARLNLRVADPGLVTTATNDVLAARTTTGNLLVTFSAWHTLCGMLPEGTSPKLEALDNTENSIPGSSLLSAAPGTAGFLALAHSSLRFALAYGETTAEARSRAEAGLECNLEQTIADRLAFINRLPVLHDPAETRFFRKCASVMKVNTLSPEAAIRQHWSTPDRVPHQHMWLWDSVFHSIGMNWIDPDLSWEFLQAMIEHAHPDGCMPITVHVNGASYPMTQPPILAWGIWENYKVTGDKTRLRQALPILESYLEWNLKHRDQNSNCLLEWLIEEDEDCRSGESGMDNSPRFDSAVTLDAVDFSTFQACDMDCLAKICRELGLDSRGTFWQMRSQQTSQAIHSLLWDAQVQFYTDRDLRQGNLTHIRAVSGFLPLLLADIPAEHAAALVDALADPTAFASSFPIPSVSLDHPQWSTDMWRGSTWINFNYLVVQALRERGYRTEARRLADTTLAVVRREYERFGVLFEFFDATSQLSPPECDRKGPRRSPYDIRRKFDSIRDYHWTAALCLSLLFQREKGIS